MQDWEFRLGFSSTVVKPTFWQDFKSVIKGGEAYLPGYSQKTSKYLEYISSFLSNLPRIWARKGSSRGQIVLKLIT